MWQDACHWTLIPFYFILLLHVAKLPRITTHPKDSDAVQGKPVTFTVQATGTKPLNYHWERTPAKEGRNDKWQPCSSAEWSHTATLTIPNVQKSNEGSYRCVISNCAGSQTSKPAKLKVTHNGELNEF